MYILSPNLPKFTEAKAVIKFLDKKSVSDIADFLGKIKEQTGNPKNPVNFSNPDIWIEKLLSGNEEKLARELWEGGEKQANPRYLQRSENFSVWSGFLKDDKIYAITDKGKKFINDDKEVAERVDRQEGIYFVLKIINEQGSCKRADLLNPWETFLNKKGSRISTKSVISLSLFYRLSNIYHRGLTKRKGYRYSLTKEGKNYLNNFQPFALDSTQEKQDQEKQDKDPSISDINETLENQANEQQIADAVDKHNQTVLEYFQKKLLKMDPTKFEHFIGKLLDKMGHKNEVTKRNADGGIDIIARSKLGFHEGVEVFQVKRQERTIDSPDIDRLIGAMHKHKTSFGVFVTLGKFSKPVMKRIEENYEKRSVKINLIDGEKLMKLIEEYGVGIEKIPTNYDLYEVDEEVFD